ncbi:MAG: iron-sulfur cluster assembly scaffold protein [Candidatus Dojkabacteria bacterium]
MTEAQEVILQNYKEPSNFGEPSWSPTSTSKMQNLTCGDEVTMYIQIEDEKVKNIAFTGEGCSISIATASILSQELQNKTLNDVLKYSENELIDLLGIELTTSRRNCALISLEAIKEAVRSNIK